jgi:hypothetical protein
MPHIDDGILHAWLDGAVPALAEAGALPDGMDTAAVASHLRSCADCAARLEAEREIREAAGLVLADAGLGAVDVPPFEHVAGEAGQAPRSGWHRRLVPLAWAASLVLAIGAGWSAGLLWRADRVATDGARPDALAAEASPATGGAAVADAGMADTGQAGLSTPVERESTTAAATDRLAAASVDAARPAPASAEDRTTAAAGAAAAARAGDVAVAESAAPPVAAAPADAMRLEDLAVAAAPATARARESAEARAEASANFLSPGTPGQLAVPTPPTAPAAPRADARSAGSASAQVETLREAMRLEAEGRLEWLPLPADAADPVHRQAWIVAGAGHPSIEVAALPFPLGKLVRSRQQLADGAVIRLYAWREQGARLDEVVVTSARGARQERRAGAATTDRTEATPTTPRPQAAEVQPKAAGADASGAAAAVHVAAGVLPSGEHELVVRVADRSVLIILRGDVAPEILGSVAQRLVPAQ